MEKDCNNCKFELYNPDEIPCKDCGMDDREYWLPKPPTNADRIRAMSDEELAKLFCGFCKNAETCAGCPMYDGDCAESELTECWVVWLKQPADMRGEEDGNC